MTPGEKADELVEKFMNYSYFSDGNNSMNRQYQRENNAKQCALIVVDEIIIEYRVLMIETAFCYDQFKYWQEVKTEIQAL